ncbi:MAG: hypothetical protein K1X94_05430 [Sandaracinaceae bacterium]|nr:hypothetical protein [Sandaracinaceae bacterium]
MGQIDRPEPAPSPESSSEATPEPSDGADLAEASPSGAALVSLPLVIVGWLLEAMVFQGFDVLLVPGGLVLLAGAVAAILGLQETEPKRPDRRGGRGLAKVALGLLLGPVLLACLVFGLILLTCAGH